MTTAEKFTPIEKIRLERRAKYTWLSLVVLLLGLQLAIGGIAIYFSVKDPTNAIVPDYHVSAINWDEQRRALQAASALGWNVQVIPATISDDKGGRALEFIVLDQAGNGVEGLNVRGRIYHHARASQTESIVFKESTAGHYICLAPMARDGVWQVDLEVEGADRPMKHSQVINTSKS